VEMANGEELEAMASRADLGRLQLRRMLDCSAVESGSGMELEWGGCKGTATVVAENGEGLSGEWRW